jgi:hypothetical protein
LIIYCDHTINHDIPFLTHALRKGFDFEVEERYFGLGEVEVLLLDLELGLSWAGAVFGGSLCLGTP